MKNDDSKYFFLTLIDNKTYCKGSIRCNEVTLVGPKKKYTFNDQESKILEKLNQEGLVEAWSFKYFLVSNKKFFIEKADSKKICNSVVSIHEETYSVEKVILMITKFQWFLQRRFFWSQ